LLAVLLIEADQVVSLDRIAAELWGDVPPKTVDNQIHGYVARLRRLLGDGRGQLLVTQSPGYRLRIGPDDTDLGRFVALAEQGRSALHAGRTDKARSDLTEALALWRGAAFQDVPATPPVQVEANRLNELRASAREDLAEARLLRGEHAVVVTELAELVGEAPLRERARELQMLALYRQGRQAEALGVYMTIRTMLAEELGVDPSASLRKLYERILRADPELAASEPQQVEPDPMLPVHQLPHRSVLARRRMLLVFDDAAHVSQIRPLLPATSSCAVVITSRRQMTDLVGARHVELDVLAPVAARDLFAAIVGARRVAAEPEQAEAILRFCGYLPLAIRIAGGRLVGRTAWPLRELYDRLEDQSRRLSELRVRLAAGLPHRQPQGSYETGARVVPNSREHSEHVVLTCCS
jgi:DNA-binding SARP family transcriptional activator